MNLPYLDAAITETIRIFSLVLGRLERYLGKPIRVDGLNIPVGVIASTGAYDQDCLEGEYRGADE